MHPDKEANDLADIDERRSFVELVPDIPVLVPLLGFGVIGGDRC